ncbi:hypothetical protein HDV04_006166 [Boothiomyces sp. JEL0838]|nr:hypothetical protein HDV04_006166 [Boothiomyces sp. JEL0838]
MIPTSKDLLIHNCQVTTTPQKTLSVSLADCQKECTSCIWVYDGQCKIYHQGFLEPGNSICGHTSNCNVLGNEIICPTILKRQTTQGIAVDSGTTNQPTYTPPPPQSSPQKQDYTLYYIGGGAVFLIILITMLVIYYIRKSNQGEYQQDIKTDSTSIKSSPVTVSSQMTVNYMGDEKLLQFKDVDTMDGIVSPYPKRNVPLSPNTNRMSGLTRESTVVGMPLATNSPFFNREPPLDAKIATDIQPPILHPSLFEK